MHADALRQRDGRQHHQTGCSDISVGAVTWTKSSTATNSILYESMTRKNCYSLVLLYACICVTTCISSAWRSCIWLSTIQTTTLTSRWRSYLNHFGDHVQFWHPHWIHLVHVCFDNLFSLSQLIPLSHTCMNVYGCCLLTVCSVFFEPQTVVEPPSEVDIRAKTTCLCITTNMQYACHILPLHHCSCYGNQIQSIGCWRH